VFQWRTRKRFRSDNATEEFKSPVLRLLQIEELLPRYLARKARRGAVAAVEEGL
jgi:hypothetical protein